jgi:hypothetical protein
MVALLAQGGLAIDPVSFWPYRIARGATISADNQAFIVIDKIDNLCRAV